jgi:hypothetical protein
VPVKCSLQRSFYSLVYCNSLPFCRQPLSPPPPNGNILYPGGWWGGWGGHTHPVLFRTAVQDKTVFQTTPRQGIIWRELPFRDGCSARGDRANRGSAAQCFSTEGPEVLPKDSASWVDSTRLFWCHSTVSCQGFSLHSLLSHWTKTATNLFFYLYFN